MFEKASIPFFHKLHKYEQINQTNNNYSVFPFQYNLLRNVSPIPAI